MKKCLVICLFSFLLFGACQASVIMSQDKAFDRFMPNISRIEKKTYRIDQDDKKALLALAGAAHSEHKALNRTFVDYYLGYREGKVVVAAYIETHPGKWGDIEMIWVVDVDRGAIKAPAVMAYVEKRGRPIARLRFLKQFVGKTIKDKLEVGEDIQAVTGATISSMSAAAMGKHAILFYEYYVKDDVARINQ